MKAEEKAKLIEKAIKLTYSSLASHLPYTYAKYPPPENQKNWYKEAVQEYAEIIYILSKLY